jgi:hypothetical protein
VVHAPPRHFSLAAGTVISVLGTVVGALVLLFVRPTLDPLPAFGLLLAGAIILLLAPHCLTHYLVGRLVGIRFLYYFFSHSALGRLPLPGVRPLARRLPLLTIKVAPLDLLRVPRKRAAAMLASGTAVSMGLPWFAVVYGFMQGQSLAAILVAVFAVANVGFTLYFSPRVGDLSRARRVLAGRLLLA